MGSLLSGHLDKRLTSGQRLEGHYKKGSNRYIQILKYACSFFLKAYIGIFVSRCMSLCAVYLIWTRRIQVSHENSLMFFCISCLQ